MIDNSQENIGLELFIDSVFEYCILNSYGLAIWQMPDSDLINLIVSFHVSQINFKEVESLPSGFLIAGFEQGLRGEKLFLKADLNYTFNKHEISKNQAEKLFPDLIQSEKFSLSNVISAPFTLEYKNKYQDIVITGIDEIRKGKFKKLVLARTRSASYSGKISPGRIFCNVIRKYNNTFNSLTFTPFSGLWIGASPEVLVSKNRNQIFKTVAIAGTQSAGNKSEKEASWNQKEIEEQSLVSKYIVEKLKQIRLREFDDIGPKTVRVGHLFHLKTEFVINLNEVNYPNLLSDMLDLLHPTSAVCGMPRNEAVKFILKQENFNRELYSGYMGPLNFDNETHLYVNLRCVKISDGEIISFAGAGITEDSDPEKEFYETENKLDSLSDCL